MAPGLTASGAWKSTRDQPGQAVAESDPEQPPHHGQGHRLGEELPQDVPPPRPQRRAHADLPGALPHRDQHHVHDADPADQEPDGGEQDRDEEEHAGEPLVQVHELRLRGDAEVVRLVGPHAAAAAQQLGDLVAQRLHALRPARADHQVVDRLAVVPLPGEEGQGEDGEVVLVLAEELALRLQHPDHEKPVPVVVDPLPDGTAVRETARPPDRRPERTPASGASPRRR